MALAVVTPQVSQDPGQQPNSDFGGWRPTNTVVGRELEQLGVVALDRPGQLDADLWARANAFAEASMAAATLQGYRGDLRHFQAWCDARGLSALPASAASVGAYAADLATWAKPATIARRLAAIAAAHRFAGHESPTTDPWCRQVHRGIRRQLGVRPEGKQPLRLADLRRVLEHLPDGTAGTRDACAILLTWFGALRASSAVAACWEHLTPVDRGAVLLVPRSKNDPEGHGHQIALPFTRDPRLCPVRALDTWRQVSGRHDGPILRPVDRWGRIGDEALSRRSLLRLVKRAVARAGLDPDRFGAHSLRSGVITEAALRGGEAGAARQSGHRSLEVLRLHYILPEHAFEGNAVVELGA